MQLLENNNAPITMQNTHHYRDTVIFTELPAFVRTDLFWSLFLFYFFAHFHFIVVAPEPGH